MTDTNHTLTDRILSKIDEEHLLPRSRWSFILENWFFWSLGGLAIAIGAFAFAAALFEIANTGWQFYAVTHPDFFTFFMQSAPLLWLLALLAFVYVGYENIRHTKRGYRYPISLIVVGAILTSIVIGSGIYAAGFGEEIDEALGDYPPFYQPVVAHEHSLWERPGIGLLGGSVSNVAPDLNTFTLQDFHGKTWQVDATNLDQADMTLIARGGDVRVEGVVSTSSLAQASSTPIFYACAVFPFQIYGRPEGALPRPLALIASTSERNAAGARNQWCKGTRPYGPPR